MNKCCSVHLQQRSTVSSPQIRTIFIFFKIKKSWWWEQESFQVILWLYVRLIIKATLQKENIILVKEQLILYGFHAEQTQRYILSEYTGKWQFLVDFAGGPEHISVYCSPTLAVIWLTSISHYCRLFSTLAFNHGNTRADAHRRSLVSRPEFKSQ